MPMILLDSCVLFWLEQDPAKISAPAKQALTLPGALCFASSISALEIGLKVRRGQLRLPLPPGDWLQEVCSRRSIAELPVDFAVAASSASLPVIHKDPFDRILIATAMAHALTLVTPDSCIPQYPNLKTLW
jgi:PIN domain nuclease of toxin-antitoxin system